MGGFFIEVRDCQSTHILILSKWQQNNQNGILGRISSELLHYIEYIKQQENHSTTMEDKNKASNSYDFGVYGEIIATEEHEEIKVKPLNTDMRTLLSSKFGIVRDQLQVASVLNKTVFCSPGDVVKDINKVKGVLVCSDEDEGSIQVYSILDGSRGKNFEPCSGESFVPTNPSMMELIESRRDVWFHHIFSGEVDRKLEDRSYVIVIFGQHLSLIFGSLDTVTREGKWGQQGLTDCLGMEMVKVGAAEKNHNDIVMSSYFMISTTRPLGFELWDPGGYSYATTMLSSSFCKIWDPGGKPSSTLWFLFSTHHLEDKVILLGREY